MKKYFIKLLPLGLAIALLTPTSFLRADDMNERIQTAIDILGNKASSSDPIPLDLISHAKGVAIFTVTKAGLGLGGQGGEGIVIRHIGDVISQSWSAPSAFNLGGGSVGAQIGFTQDSYIIILNTEEVLRHFTSKGKMNWDATATGTAGSDSETEKATTAYLQRREMVIYKASSGVFGGATLGGSWIERKDEINQQAYGDDVHERNILNGTVAAPLSSGRLYNLLNGKA